MKHIDIKEILKDSSYIGTQVTVCGWVRTSRDSKNMAFIELNDGTSLSHLQIVIDKSKLSDISSFMPGGTALKVIGTVVKGAVNNAVEVNADEITLLGECPSDYPLQKKRCSLEFLRTIPHLRVRTNTFNAVLRVRSVAAAAIHSFFQQNNYVYIHTPLLTASDCEGAGEVFKVTTIGYSDKYKSEEEYYADDFFGRKAGLSVSGQLEGEAMALAFGKIYTFGPTFRAEKSYTNKHTTEFSGFDLEFSYITSFKDVMKMEEELLNNSGYQTTDAVKNRKVYTVPAKHVLCVSQYIVNAVEDLADAVYSE